MTGRPKGFRTGALRYRCTVQTVIETQDSYGQPVTTWETLHANEPCDVIKTQGNEIIRGRQVAENVRAIVTVRYRSGYNEQARIVYGGENYNIVFIDPVDGRNRYLELHCRK